MDKSPCFRDEWDLRNGGFGTAGNRLGDAVQEEKTIRQQLSFIDFFLWLSSHLVPNGDNIDEPSLWREEDREI